MKIAFCKSWMDVRVSGADEALVNYATQLPPAGVESVVLLLHPCPAKNDRLPRLLRAGVSVRCLAAEPYYFALRAWRKLLSWLPGARQRGLPDWGTLVYRASLRFFLRERPDVAHVFFAQTK